MVREIVKDEAFLSQRSVPAAAESALLQDIKLVPSGNGVSKDE